MDAFHPVSQGLFIVEHESGFRAAFILSPTLTEVSCKALQRSEAAKSRGNPLPLTLTMPPPLISNISNTLRGFRIRGGIGPGGASLRKRLQVVCFGITYDASDEAQREAFMEVPIFSLCDSAGSSGSTNTAEAKDGLS